MREETEANPSVKVQERFLKPHEFARLDIFRELRFSSIFANDMGYLDGRTFGFQTWTYPTSVQLEWWEDVPEAWRDIIEWAANIRDYLTNLLDEQDESFKDINQQFEPNTPVWRYVE